MKKFWSKRIRDMVPYVPGEQPKDRKFIKLNTNENPYPPSPKALEAIRAAVGDGLRLYPDPECAELRDAIAEYHGLPSDMVFAGNGSDEILAFCFQAFFDPDRTILFPDITYSVVVANPNAPTGRAIELHALRAILESNRDCVVLVDEAYVDFGAQSAAGLVPEYDNLVVVHTLSKSRSLAGLRVGYALGQPNLTAALRCVRDSINSYTVDRLAQAGGAAAMRDRAYFEATAAKVQATRERTAARLRELGFTVYPSAANFIFISHPDRAARALLAGLREKGVLVRWFDRPRIDNYLRVSIGTDEEMDAFCAAVQELLTKT